MAFWVVTKVKNANQFVPRPAGDVAVASYDLTPDPAANYLTGGERVDFSADWREIIGFGAPGCFPYTAAGGANLPAGDGMGLSVQRQTGADKLKLLLKLFTTGAGDKLGFDELANATHGLITTITITIFGRPISDAV